MEPLDALLTFLFWCDPSEYDGDRFSGQKLCNDINADGGIGHVVYMQTTDLSNLRQGRQLSEAKKDGLPRLLRGQSNEDKRQKIANKLGFPDLFSFRSVDVLILALRKNFADRYGEVDVLIEEAGKGSTEFIGSEWRTVAEIARRLSHAQYPVLSWTHRFDLGAAQILSKLVANEKIAQKYSKIAHLWPCTFSNPFQAELLALCSQVADDGTMPASPAGILRLLREKRVLVIVHVVEAIELDQFGNNALNDVFKEILKEVKKIDPDSPSDPEVQKPANQPLFLLSGTRSFFDIVGMGNSFHALKRNEDEISRKIDDALMHSADRPRERAGVIRQALREMAGTKDVPDLEETGPLLRRAELAHQGNRLVEAAPIHQRIGALAIARHDNRSSFLDPTGGFDELVGGDFSAYSDVVLFHREVKCHVEYLWERNNRTVERRSRVDRKNREDTKPRLAKRFPDAPHLETILKVSTGLHWVSRNALDALDDVRLPTPGADPVREESRPPVRNNQHWVHVEESGEFSSTAIYFCSLGAKAILQDTWRERSPGTRRRAHYLVARYLDSIEDDKARLPEEYPYAPHWGRSRIYFLGEKIRFLIRALDNEMLPGDTPLRLYTNFPSEPNAETGAPEPHEVLNYCYRTVFRQEMNGDRPNDRKRNLSKRHGAFRYAAELLALMSEDENIGVPHPALDKTFHREFVRECGLALLDIGLANEAAECFAHLERMTARQLQSMGNTCDPEELDSLLPEHLDAMFVMQDTRELERLDAVLLEHLDAMLVSSLVYFARGDVDGGWSKTLLASNLLDKWHERRGRLNKADGGSDWKTYQQFQNRKRQVELRRAQKLYLTGEASDCEKVVALLQSLEHTAPSRIQVIREAPELRQLISKELPSADLTTLDAEGGEPEHLPEGRQDRDQLRPRRGPLDTELVHFKIAALRRLAQDADNEQAGLEVAMKVCIQALLRSSSDGMHHDAMGLRISLADIYRRLGANEIAEVVMDEVHADLLRFGASERTFLAFLTESARILIETDREIHGYVTYLRPCIFRASSRGFTRDASRAAALAIPVLEKLRRSVEAADNHEAAATDWQTRVALALVDFGRLEQITTDLSGGGFASKSGEPLFAYSVPNVREQILSICTVEGINAEIRMCEKHAPTHVEGAFADVVI